MSKTAVESVTDYCYIGIVLATQIRPTLHAVLQLLANSLTVSKTVVESDEAFCYIGVVLATQNTAFKFDLRTT